MTEAQRPNARRVKLAMRMMYSLAVELSGARDGV
jgi:hypothetical protein